MGYDILEQFDCGRSVETTTPEEIAKAIRSVKELDSDAYTALCNNARNAAAHFDIPILAKQYLNEIDRILTKFNTNKAKRKGNQKD